MRLTAFVLIATLAATSVFAQSTNVGRVYCSPHFMCPGDIGTPDPASLAANASACVYQSFGSGSMTQYFDTTAGLNSSNCLTPTSEVSKLSNDGSISVQCCSMPTADHLCTFKCEINRL